MIKTFKLSIRKWFKWNVADIG